MDKATKNFPIFHFNSCQDLDKLAHMEDFKIFTRLQNANLQLTNTSIAFVSAVLLKLTTQINKWRLIQIPSSKVTKNRGGYDNNLI